MSLMYYKCQKKVPFFQCSGEKTGLKVVTVIADIDKMIVILKLHIRN